MREKSKQSTQGVLKYRLGHIWILLNNSGKNEFQSREAFEGWAAQSGYKPWKILALIDASGTYNADNCCWKTDKRIRGEIRSISEDDTESHVCRIIKKLAYETEEIGGRLENISALSLDLTNSRCIKNRSVVKVMTRELEEALSRIKSCEKMLDKIKLKL